MAARHNACVNPACSVNASSWGGASAPTRVTGLTGYNRTTGARYTSGGYLVTPAGAAAASDVVTISLDLLTEVFDDTVVDLYFYVTRSVGGDAQVGTLSTIGLTAGVVARPSITRTCPANTTGAFLIVDGINMTISPAVATAVLIEVASSAGTYFDGDSPGGSWDGTTGLSASTLSTEITQPIGPAGETDTAQSLGRSKTRPTSTAATSDVAQSLARTKIKTIMPAALVEAARPIGRLKSRSIGVATTLDITQALSRVKSRTVGVAPETDAALSFGGTPAVASISARAGRPQTAWTAGSPRTAWSAGRPQTSWEAGEPRA